MYLDHFGLTELPFNVTPNPRFLYLTDGHRIALEHLTYGITNRKGFVVLTGDVGTGKTTLCRALLGSLRKECRTALILNPRLSEPQLLRAILHDLGVADVKGDRLTMRELLSQVLLDESRLDRSVVLIIDEAQQLTLDLLEQLRLLSNIETDDRKLLQIVLVGQPELDQKLACPQLRQLRQRITVRCSLTPLSRDETLRYVAHRLTVAGSDGRTTFCRDALEAIFENAAGIPRLVNAISDMSLLAAFAAERTSVQTNDVCSAVEELEASLS
jgi:general secretion pathway protein A